MIALNIHQIDIVWTVIEQQDLKHESLKAELLDHYCCLVESYMDSGHSFERSLKKCVSDFESSDLQEIEKIIVQQSKNKNLFMKNLVVLTAMVILITTTFMFAQENTVPILRPVSAEHMVSSKFGMQVHPIKKVKRHHDGIDIAAPIGTPVYAPADGKVILAKDDKNKFGKHIKISHGDTYETMYSHLSELKVKEGQIIKKGDVIGAIGNTGLSTGPHLHYEVSKDGEKMDPLDFMKEERL